MRSCINYLLCFAFARFPVALPSPSLPLYPIYGLVGAYRGMCASGCCHVWPPYVLPTFDWNNMLIFAAATFSSPIPFLTPDEKKIALHLSPMPSSPSTPFQKFLVAHQMHRKNVTSTFTGTAGVNANGCECEGRKARNSQFISFCMQDRGGTIVLCSPSRHSNDDVRHFHLQFPFHSIFNFWLPFKWIHMRAWESATLPRCTWHPIMCITCSFDETVRKSHIRGK